MSEMYLVGYQGETGPLVGFEEDGCLYSLEMATPTLDYLLANVPATELIGQLRAARGAEVTDAVPVAPTHLQEIWAAGVTYKTSEEARERESDNSTIYTRVYSAERPEIFMKAMGYDVVSSGEPAGIRRDATWSVPEPELTLVINRHMELIGFTVGNDMSSRDIEGANPLYLPQAKVYDASCALSPRIWLQPGATQWPDVTIQVRIERAGQTMFAGQTNTGQIKRTLAELVEYLGRCKSFRHGVLLMTGTGVVPPDEFTLLAGDTVAITIEPIGQLVNEIKLV
ncbi:MAG: fumarylacetoacetate hydrolase family protein [Anaerolineales bacterium]|nr:fumarylacetoacetate hydrolase family protein [Anaerolineales bacterium]MCB8961030.1 fumarylacetoacetate hydrolase family protein [Ardenticatenales bacterium]